MTDYASLKVPDLKKLLQERSLPQTGNKADLIARLQENDKSQAEDVIDWDDDDTKIAAITAKKDDPKPAPAPASAPSPAPAAKETPAAPSPEKAKSVETAESEAPVASAVQTEHQTEDATTTDVPANKIDADSSKDVQPAETTSSFALGLDSTDAELERKKREERAKRFGINIDADSDEAKKAERAKRFGVDNSAIVKGLDDALPERRPKRARDHGDEGHSGGKRQNFGGRSNNKSRGGRGGGGRNQRQGGGRGRGSKNGILDDPEEKRKAEGRAKRFAGGN